MEQIGFWGALGAKAPSKEYAEPVYPLNIPTLSSQAEYNEIYPLGMHEVMNSMDTPLPHTLPNIANKKTSSSPDADSVPGENTSSVGTNIALLFIGAILGAAALHFYGKFKGGQQAYSSIN